MTFKLCLEEVLEYQFVSGRYRRLLKTQESSNLQNLSLESFINLDLVSIMPVYQLCSNRVNIKKLLTDLTSQNDKDGRLIFS